MEIRNYNSDDASGVVEIYNYHIKNTTVTFETDLLSSSDMDRRLTLISQSYPCIVCEDEGEIIGYAYAHAWKEKAAYRRTVETTLYVREKDKNRGVGTALINKLVASCREMGFHVLIACITAENSESMIFHEKHGFRLASRFHEVGYKFGRWIDIVDYEMILPC